MTAHSDLHVCYVHRLYPPVGRMNGISRYLGILAPAVAAAGHEVSVITDSRIDGPPATEGNPRIVTVPMASRRGIPGSLFHSYAFARALRRLHAERPVDVVEWTNLHFEGLASTLRSPAAHVTRVSTMEWQARETAVQPSSSLRNRIGETTRDTLEASALRRSDLLLCSTREHARQVRGRVGASVPIAICALGTARRPIIPRENDGPLTFLFLGRLEARKGVDVLIAAFDLYLRRGGPDARLTLCGEDTTIAPGDSFLEQALEAVSETTRERVEHLGFVTDEEILTLYSRAAAFVAPSRYESFGLILPEAMQQQLPVVATAVGGIPEVITDGHDGLLVRPDDPEGLAEAMLRLATQPRLRHDLGARAHETWEARYSEESMAARSIDTYGDAAQRALRRH